MSSKALCMWVRIAVIAVTVCGLILCGYLIPLWGADIATVNPGFENWYFPWLIFLWVVSLPCFSILIFVWKVSGAIKCEEVFTSKTANWIKISAVLLFADVGFFFVGNLVFWLIGINLPGVLLLSLLVDIFAIALAVLAAVLSRYITKAAVLQEDSEGTI